MENKKNNTYSPEPELGLVIIDEEIKRDHDEHEKRLKQILKTLEMVLEIEKEWEE